MNVKKLVVPFITVFIATFLTACGNSDNNQTNVSTGDSQSLDANEENTTEPTPQTTQKDSGTIGDYEVSILKSEVIKNLKDKKAMMVTYKFKNNSKETTKFTNVLTAEAYQNSTALKQADIAENSPKDIENLLVEVKPGESKEMYEAYELQDDSNVTVKVSKAGQNTEEEEKDTSMISKKFSVK